MIIRHRTEKTIFSIQVDKKFKCNVGLKLITNNGPALLHLILIQILNCVKQILISILYDF